METDAVRLNRLPLAPASPPGLDAPSNPPIPPRPAGPACGVATAGAADPSAFLRVEPRRSPSPHVLATLRSALNSPGLRPKLRGRSFSPGDGFGSSKP